MRFAKGALSVVLIMLLAACTTSRMSDEPRSSQDPAEINAQLGLGYLQQGNLELAMKKLEYALELNPDLGSAHHYLAEVYRQLGEDAKAGTHYRKALEALPDDPQLNNNYGVFLCQHQKPGEAEERFLSASRAHFYKTPEVAFKNAGQCALLSADPEKAEFYFRKALDIAPRMSSVLYEMAQLQFEQQRYLHARAFLQRYMAAVRRPSADSLLLGVRIERRLGDEGAAVAYARDLKMRFPNSDQAIELLESEGK